MLTLMRPWMGAGKSGVQTNVHVPVHSGRQTRSRADWFNETAADLELAWRRGRAICSQMARVDISSLLPQVKVTDTGDGMPRHDARVPF